MPHCKQLLVSTTVPCSPPAHLLPTPAKPHGCLGSAHPRKGLWAQYSPLAPHQLQHTQSSSELATSLPCQGLRARAEPRPIWCKGQGWAAVTTSASCARRHVGAVSATQSKGQQHSPPIVCSLQALGGGRSLDALQHCPLPPLTPPDTLHPAGTTASFTPALPGWAAALWAPGVCSEPPLQQVQLPLGQRELTYPPLVPLFLPRVLQSPTAPPAQLSRKLLQSHPCHLHPQTRS